MRSRWIKRLYRGVFIVVSVLILLSVILLILFHFNKDRIETELLRIAHELQPGEIILGDMDLSLFAQFPKVSLRLGDVEYYERPSHERTSEDKPVLKARHIYVSMDVIKLIRGVIEVTKVTLEQGEADLIVHRDGKLNLLNALVQPGEASAGSGPREMLISDIEIKDVVLHFRDMKTSLEAQVLLKSVSSDIVRYEDMNDVRLDTELEIIYITAQDRKRIRNRSLGIDLVFRLNTKTQVGEILKGELDSAGVKFRIAGGFDLKQKGFLDLDFDASDQDMTLLSLLIEEDVLKYNRDLPSRGDLFLNGSIKGEILGTLPLFELYFGAENIHLGVPGSSAAIEDFGFSGYLSTGQQPDLSQARLEVSEVKAKMPGGSLNGALSVQNLKKPRVAMQWESRTDLAYMDEIFKLGSLEGLGGIVSLTAKLDGEIDQIDSSSLMGLGDARVTLSDVFIRERSWERPIEKLNGVIEYSGREGLSMKDISLQLGPSDVIINGDIQKLIVALFDREADITVQLRLDSKGMRIGDAFFFRELSPSLANLNLQNMSLECSLRTPASVFSGFNSVPPGDIRLHHFQAELEDYLTIQKLSGSGKLVDGDNGALVLGEDLKMELPFGTINLEGELGFPRSLPVTLDADLKIEDFRLKRFESDPVSSEAEVEDAMPPDPRAGLLNASLKLAADFPRSPLSLGRISISQGDVKYDTRNRKDILLRDVEIDLKELILDSSASSGPLTGIEAWKIDLRVGHIQTELIKDLGLTSTIEGQQDAWRCDFSTDGLFGEQELGHFEIHFREPLPVYRIRYEIFDFDIQTLQEKMGGERLLNGKMDILADLSFSGTTWQEMLGNANGQLIQRGEDLVLKSLDLDKILKNFKRSQSFNLADVGAFFFAGPVGVVATKSMDFASIASRTPGDETTITRFLSHCQINGGIIETRDVAITTLESRIALQGKVDFALGRIMDLSVAAVDKKGCILISQSVSGNFDDLEWGEINVVGTLLGAVTNVLKTITGDKCQPFYTGSLPHPQK